MNKPSKSKAEVMGALTNACVIATQSVQIKKQKLAIEILVRIVDELRRPYMDGPQHDLYLLGTDGLNELERLAVI